MVSPSKRDLDAENTAPRAGPAGGAAARSGPRRDGAARFEELGLPGGALVDAGLADLARGAETVASLAVSMAAPRLRREGVPVPSETFPEADHRLYRRLEAENPDLAHSRYLAYLREVQSFADACPTALRREVNHA